MLRGVKGSSGRCYLKPLLCVKHAIISTALFRRHHGPDLLFGRQPEVGLQHPPVRIHPWQEGADNSLLLKETLHSTSQNASLSQQLALLSLTAGKVDSGAQFTCTLEICTEFQSFPDTAL